jgi:hypothetical protein
VFSERTLLEKGLVAVDFASMQIKIMFDLLWGPVLEAMPWMM